jgi:electron transfer flavoprotein alpha subunit
MRCIITSALVFFLQVCTSAQTKLFTKTGTISFFSKTNIENISARNNKVLAVWELASGKIEFSVLMKGFEFEKALMQEHFNEDYVESDKYPKAILKAVMENSNTIVLTADKTYAVKINGTLSMHGVTKPVSTIATIKVKDGIASASAVLPILLADYNIKIPAVVADNISKKIDISINIPSFKSL